MAAVVTPTVKVSRFARTLLAAGVLLVTVLPASAGIPAGGQPEPDQPLTEVADLRYGVALYHYYQKDYFSALSELQVAELRGGIQGHGTNPEIIEAGISLAFGMQTTAQYQFAQLLDEHQPVAVRNTAWFYLAKLAYMRGHWQQAKDALNKLEHDALSQVMRQEAESIGINLLIRRGDLAHAASGLDLVDKNSPWYGILHYNLASALGREQRFHEALPYYEKVYDRKLAGDYPEPEIPLALHDRARTAAGYAMIAQEQYYRAYLTFDKVRLHSGQANQALLGSGWAAFNRDRLDQALAPWQELLRRPEALAEAQEARLAIPYAYEKLGAVGEALLSYSSAESAFENELKRIAAARQQLLQGDLLSLLGITGSANSSWLEGVPTDISHMADYLHKLIAQNPFQAQTQRLRDLDGLAQNLRQWQTKLEQYVDLTHSRVAFRLSERQRVDEQEYPPMIRQLYNQQWQLQLEINRIKQERDYLAFADPGDDLIQRARNALTLSQQLDTAEPQQQAKAKLLHGLLYWGQAQQYHGHLYRAQRDLDVANDTIKELSDSYLRVIDHTDNAEDLAPIIARLTSMQARVSQEQTQLANTMAKLSDELKQELITELNSQQLRVTYLLSEARLAIARLYDGRLLKDAPAAGQGDGGDS